MHPSFYPLLGLLYPFQDPETLGKILGLTLLELLVPIYWVSDRLVEKHHRQVFDGVLSRQLGQTRPVLPLDATEKQQVQRLVTKHRQAGHLKKGGDDIAQKIEERSRTAPPAVKVLLWIFAPPPANEPWWKRLPRRLVNAPARLIFPAGSKLLQAGNSRSYAMNALKPYLKRKGITSWEEQAAVAYENRWSFRAFGAVAYGLGFVPILSWILNFTTSIGAALWAADMERGNKLHFA
ncbi:g11659 [Coccomyxa elongata]